MTTSEISLRPPARRSWLRGLACAGLLGVALTVVFWRPLWTGGGLIGGDIYYYFMPQKVAYAEALRTGQWPIWNNRVGHGYPTVGESQTGVFYPPHLLLYGLLPVDRAYAVSVLGHYVLSFLGTWLLARRLQLGAAGALLAATVYTYGWFPSRISLEWSISTGAWLPVALWLLESFLQTRQCRYAFFLGVTLAVQMLPGHFTLAFITQLCVMAWLAIRLGLLWWRKEPVSWRDTAVILGALAIGFALSAVQLLPTWELKQLSQRQTVTAEHDPRYGYLPPKYLLQSIAPWYWYSDESLFRTTMIEGGSRTNRIEAHLYFGLLPLALAVLGSIVCFRNPSTATGENQRVPLQREVVILWLLAGALAVIYATGWLIPLTRHLPGFSFFEGPGRYGIVTTLAVAILAGLGLDRLVAWTQPSARAALLVLALAITTGDLWIVSRLVAHAVLTARPPVAELDRSPLRKQFLEMDPPVRLLSKAGNAATILGVSAFPTYLGISPAEYFDPQLKIPDPIPFETPPTAEQLAWLRRAGVTHLLSLKPLDTTFWRDADGTPAVRYVSATLDPVLNPVLATNGPLRLYELLGTRGRAAYDGEGRVRVATLQPTHIELQAEGQGGTVILTELLFPGWTVTIDGQPAEPVKIDGMYRGVRVPAGSHHVAWTYRPDSLKWGAAISAAATLVWLAVGHLWFWNLRRW